MHCIDTTLVYFPTRHFSVNNTYGLCMQRRMPFRVIRRSYIPTLCTNIMQISDSRNKSFGVIINGIKAKWYQWDKVKTWRAALFIALGNCVMRQISTINFFIGLNNLLVNFFRRVQVLPGMTELNYDLSNKVDPQIILNTPSLPDIIAYLDLFSPLDHQQFAEKNVILLNIPLQTKPFF